MSNDEKKKETYQYFTFNTRQGQFYRLGDNWKSDCMLKAGDTDDAGRRKSSRKFRVTVMADVCRHKVCDYI